MIARCTCAGLRFPRNSASAQAWRTRTHPPIITVQHADGKRAVFVRPVGIRVS